MTKHIPTLDGLRGVAALLVMMSHVSALGLGVILNARVGDYGVVLFFELSGFLMGYLYLDRPFERRAVMRYGMARAARIVPLYYLVVLASLILSMSIGPSFVNAMDFRGFARLMLFTGSVGVFWSIGPEVQFYALFVLIWHSFASGRLGQRGWGLAVAMAAALVILAQSRFPGVTLFSKLHLFLIGVLVSRWFAAARGDGGERGVTAIQLVAAALLLGVALPHPPFVDLLYPVPVGSDLKHDSVYGNLKIALMAGVVLAAFAHETRFSRAILANRIARLAGRYSFSLYLLHVPVMQGVGLIAAGHAVAPAMLATAGVLAAFAASAVSFTIVERPAQRAIRRLTMRWTQDAGTASPSAIRPA